MQDFASVKSFYQTRGLAERVGWGTKPAILVVDLTKGFTDPDSPLGSDLGDVILETNRVIDAARASSMPVIFTSIAYDDPERDAGFWLKKIPSLAVLRSGTAEVEVDPRLERRADEPVIVKRFGSSFAGTDLQARLSFAGVDTLVLCGTSTSGCIRATAIDAIQHGFRCIVPESAVGDRAEAPHIANLFDIDAKYGDVVTTDEVIARLRTPPGAPD